MASYNFSITMNLIELKQVQLSRQHITSKTDQTTVIQDLCGIQCQFLSNAVHSLKIRCSDNVDKDELGEKYIKNWTIRGTLHMISEADIPLFKYDDGFYRLDEWDDEFSNGRLWISGERKKYFAHYIIDCVSSGISKRDKLRLSCIEAGMTKVEESFVFDSWGGLLRPLCERGFIQYKAKQVKEFKISPAYAPMNHTEAIKRQMARYLTHIAPATINDISYFFGFSKTRVKEVLNTLPIKSVVIDGKEYFYIGDINSDYPEIPKCVFLSGFDQLMLGYQKKESIYLDSRDLRGVFNLAGIVMPCLLIDGKVEGTWKYKNDNLEINFFNAIDKNKKKYIEREAATLWENIKSIKYD